MRRQIARTLRATTAVVAVAAFTVIIFAVAVEAGADKQAPPDLDTVIQRITNWLVGVAFSIATMFLTYGGIRRMLAGGDPGEVSKSKDALKNAALGYCLAILAPTLMKILQGFVGGG